MWHHGSQPREQGQLNMNREGRGHCRGRREEPGSPVLCWKGRWGEERKENLRWLQNGEGTWEGLYVVCRDVCKASLTFNSSVNSSLRSTLLLKTWGLREVQILYVGEHQVNRDCTYRWLHHKAGPGNVWATHCGPPGWLHPGSGVQMPHRFKPCLGQS